MQILKWIKPVLVAAIFTSCKSLTAPEYIDIQHLKVDAKSLNDATLSADIRMYNPNKSNLVFKSGNLDIYVENKLLGQTSLDTTIHIKKLDTFSIPVVVKLNMSNLLSNAFSIALKDSVEVKLDGKVRVGRSGIFLTRPVQHISKEKLDLF